MSTYGRERSRTLSTKQATRQCELREYATQGSNVCGWSGVLATWPSLEYSPDHTQYIGDFVTPGFRKRIAEGEIINHPFKKTDIIEAYPTGGYYHHQWGRTSTLSCSPSGQVTKQYRQEGDKVAPTAPFYVPGAIGEDRDAVISKAVTQAHANIDTSSMLALATAAEGRKTVESMASILLRVARIAKAARRLNVRALRKEFTPKELANRWMELRYAIRPLIYDVKGIMNALSVERSHVRQTFRGYASVSNWEWTTTTRGLSWNSECTIEQKAEWTISARAQVLCDVNITDVSVYGVDQPIETMWELLPFSFIIDWFANVGDTIAAWTPNAGVTQLASSVTVRDMRAFTNQVVSSRSTAYEVLSDFAYANLTYTPGAPHTRGELVLERITDPQLAVWPRINLRLDGYKLTDLGIIIRNILR